MATPQAHRIIRLAGRLVKDPTDLGLAFPHGGTALGEIRAGIFAYDLAQPAIEAEEFGGIKVDFVEARRAGALVAVLREFDDDAVATLFPNSVLGGTSGQRGIVERAWGGSSVPGELASARAVKILYSPFATGHVPAIYVPNAVPRLDEAAQIELGVHREVSVAVAFQATPASDGRVFAVQLLEDLTL